MKSRDVAGKRIVAVRHVRLKTSGGPMDSSVEEIELEDGTLLRPWAFELDSGDGYGIKIAVIKPKKESQS